MHSRQRTRLRLSTSAKVNFQKHLLGLLQVHFYFYQPQVRLLLQHYCNSPILTWMLLSMRITVTIHAQSVWTA